MSVFPTLTGMSFTVNKGPSWNTLTKKAASGRQVRVSLQSSPIWKFKLAFEYLRDRAAATSDVQNLWAFFNSVNGQFNQSGGLDCLDRDCGWLSGFSAGCVSPFLALHAGKA